MLVSPSTATVVISANDDQHGVVALDSGEPNPMYINEDQPVASALVTVRRQAGTFGQVSVKNLFNFCFNSLQNSDTVISFLAMGLA